MEQPKDTKPPQNAVNKAKLLPYGTTTLKVVGKFDAPTIKLFAALHKVSHYFQENLFQKPLSPFILSLNSAPRSKGYYKFNAWAVYNSTNLPEINIHPSLFLLDPIELMSTLVHELVHHYHQIYGHPGVGGYHNKQFAKIMNSVGLQCSNTGQPGGRDTGRQMTHYIIPNGKFDQTFKQMPESYLIPFKPIPSDLTPEDLEKIKKSKTRQQQKLKTKYTCIGCSASVWGKADLSIICGQCKEEFIVIADCGKQDRIS